MGGLDAENVADYIAGACPRTLFNVTTWPFSASHSTMKQTQQYYFFVSFPKSQDKELPDLGFPP
jgi:hypothetical protein